MATLDLGDNRSLRIHDMAPDGPVRLTILWHHGTPNTGEPPEPLRALSWELGIRWISYDRPGYGGSTPVPGRSVSDAAADGAVVADALGIDRFAVMGHSGGGPHALAVAALVPDRVSAAVCVAGLAPFDADGLDWFAGMGAGSEAELRAARAGPSVLREHLAADEFDPEMFTPADHAALSGTWGWLGEVAGRGSAAGPDPVIDDDLAYVGDWGFDPAQIAVPTMVVHGTDDRIVPAAHGRWLADHLPNSEFTLHRGEGHLSVLTHADAALRRLLDTTASR